jgi:hypothetical protein
MQYGACSYHTKLSTLQANNPVPLSLSPSLTPPLSLPLLSADHFCRQERCVDHWLALQERCSSIHARYSCMSPEVTKLATCCLRQQLTDWLNCHLLCSWLSALSTMLAGRVP